MHIDDDPFLALISRFMCQSQHLEVSDAEFLLRQISAIEEYVGQFPDSERKQRAMEWDWGACSRVSASVAEERGCA